MSTAISIDETTIRQWITEKLDPGTVEEKLVSEGFDPVAISSYLKKYRQIKNEIRQFKGFILLGVGAFLGFVSCMLALFNPFPDLFNIFLYGLTSLAVVFICIGLYVLLE